MSTGNNFDDAFIRRDTALKDASNLFNGLKNLCQEASILHLLYERPSGDDLYVKVYDVPGTLSGNILRLHANLPWDLLSRHSAIQGDEISPIPLRIFDDDNDAEEDTADLATQLPLVAFDERVHFAKPSKFRSEIPNLLKAKGLPHIVQLLGRTEDGRLVFPKLLADALISLHSIGLIHRDLALRNILATPDYRTAYLCDLECCYGSSQCPRLQTHSHTAWTCRRFPTLGNPTSTCLGILGGNWLPPAPFRSIVLACVAAEPSARPDMHQIRAMLQAIPACRLFDRIFPDVAK
ncbi:hypothetical protein B0H14DRAFT_2850951 [Mycena olivaceomarginata]|nr:hypothetical protein B0H14DRAFT_2850951 [Mycena olivaceomarginata]